MSRLRQSTFGPTRRFRSACVSHRDAADDPCWDECCWRLRHPQLLVLRKSPLDTTCSLPQSQRHNTVSRPPRRRPKQIATRRPFRLPLQSTLLIPSPLFLGRATSAAYWPARPPPRQTKFVQPCGPEMRLESGRVPPLCGAISCADLRDAVSLPCARVGALTARMRGYVQ